MGSGSSAAITEGDGEQGRGFLAHPSSSEEASLKKVLGPPPVRGQAKGPGRSIYTIALMR